MIIGFTTNIPKMTSKTPAAPSNRERALSGIATRRVRTSNPTMNSIIEWPAPQAVAETIDLRRLGLLHRSVETATTWSGSSECASPNANPVASIRIGVSSTDSETYRAPIIVFYIGLGKIVFA